jgi:hypothetical protein
VTGAWILFPAFLATAATAPRQDCAGCHHAQALSQPHTPMGRALEAAADCEILRQNPKLNWRTGAYSYQIARVGDGSIYTVTNGQDTITIPIEWAFGLGAAGQTYVYQWKGNWYESRVSFYKKLQGLDLTMGARNATFHSVEDAAGRQMSVQDAAACFNCHATGALSGSRVDVDHLAAGVQCERCHGPSERHLAAVKSGDAQHAAMRKLGALETEEMSDFCGQCHRTWAEIAMQGPRDINNVRFQPYRLANSRCYDAMDRRISCVACHDPHRETEHRAGYYDAKCLACHGAEKLLNTGQKRRAKVCPTASKDCVTCHMPKYELPDSHNLFADHWIRVVKPGAPYPE